MTSQGSGFEFLESVSMEKIKKKYTLTISCEDTMGIVSAVAGCLKDQECFILESSHFGDVLSGRFFMRTVFTPKSDTYSRKTFNASFDPIAKSFGMDVKLFDEDILPRVLSNTTEGLNPQSGGRLSDG